MADFTALKTAIQTYVKQNGNEEITGDILQGILLSIVTTLGDNAINNLQETVDSISSLLENGAVYCGIATPSTNPGTPTTKVFYIALQAGTYTNFGNLSVVNGVTILSFNGSTWSKQLLSYGDGVFDISEYKATGGTLATFTDLAAAIGTDGANVPVEVRKGGMSVKFIQGSAHSSDNKYVQCRLTKNTWSTTISDWSQETDSYIINVNAVNSKSDAYASKLAAIQAVPATMRRPGALITYLLSDSWHIDQFLSGNTYYWESEGTWRPLDYNHFVNVNLITSHPSAFSSAGDARYIVPNQLRKLGMVITYYLSDGWHIEYFKGSDVSGWTTAANWQKLNYKSTDTVVLGNTDLPTGDAVYKASVVSQTFFRKSPDFIVELNGVTQSGVNKTNCINQMEAYMKSISSINLKDELLGLLYFSVRKSGIEVHLATYTSEDVDPVSEMQISVSRDNLVAYSNKIYLGVNYKNKLVCIEFWDTIVTYMDSLGSSDSLIMQVNSSINRKYENIGVYNVFDVTNPVFNFQPIPFSMYHNEMMLWSANNCIKEVVLPRGQIGSIRYISIVGTVVQVLLEICDYNSNGYVNSSDATYYTLVGAANISENETLAKIYLIGKNDEPVKVVIDTKEILSGISSIAINNATGQNVKAPFANFDTQPYSVIRPTSLYKVYENYYYDSTPNPIASQGYYSILVPINKGCQRCIVSGVLLNKDANVAILNDNGFVISWGWTNEGTAVKYSGNDTKTSVEFTDMQSAKYILISSDIELDSCVISIYGYDESKVIEGINDVRCVQKGSYNVGSYSVSKMGDEIMAGSDMNYNLLPMMKLETIAETITFRGYNYAYSSLCDIDNEGNKYFIGVNYLNVPILWKKAADGTKTVLFYGDEQDSWKLKNGNGDTITLPSEYSEYGWLIKSWQSLFTSNGIKCLPDGELIIWLLGNKVGQDAYKIEVLFKTSNNQTNLVPKFVFSNENFTWNNRVYQVNGYIAPNNGISIIEHNGETLVAITEYGAGNPLYWFEHGVTDMNGNGIVGKTWFSHDCGDNFYKIFDFDEKINGDADDESDDNWKWADSKEYRMRVHMHGITFDEYVNKLFWTNGDGVDNLFYADIDDVISWCDTYGTPTDPTDVEAKYTDNEPLMTAVFRYKIKNSHSPLCSNGSCLAGQAYNIQIWSFLATNNALLFGHDTKRQTVTGIQHSEMLVRRNAEMDMHIDLFAMFDSDNPQTTMTGIIQNMIQKDANSPILAYHTSKGIYASYNGVNWKRVFVEDTNSPKLTFLGYFVVDKTNGDLYICKPETTGYAGVGLYKVLNY